jgi:thioredoxin-like negative regulator of GroEL
MPVALIIYSRPGCHLCQDMKTLVASVIHATGTAASLEEINVETDADLESRFGLEVPVLLVNGRKVAKFRVSEEALKRLLTAGEAGRAG